MIWYGIHIMAYLQIVWSFPVEIAPILLLFLHLHDIDKTGCNIELSSLLQIYPQHPISSMTENLPTVVFKHKLSVYQENLLYCVRPNSMCS